MDICALSQSRDAPLVLLSVCLRATVGANGLITSVLKADEKKRLARRLLCRVCRQPPRALFSNGRMHIKNADSRLPWVSGGRRGEEGKVEVPAEGDQSQWCLLHQRRQLSFACLRPSPHLPHPRHYLFRYFTAFCATSFLLFATIPCFSFPLAGPAIQPGPCHVNWPGTKCGGLRE